MSEVQIQNYKPEEVYFFTAKSQVYGQPLMLITKPLVFKHEVTAMVPKKPIDLELTYGVFEDPHTKELFHQCFWDMEVLVPELTVTLVTKSLKQKDLRFIDTRLVVRRMLELIEKGNDSYLRGFLEQNNLKLSFCEKYKIPYYLMNEVNFVLEHKGDYDV